MRLHKINFKIHINFKALALFLILCFSNLGNIYTVALSGEIEENKLRSDENFACTDIKVVYARESGAELQSLNYERFSTAFLNKFLDTGLSVSIYELGTKEGGYDGNSYPSPGIGIETWKRFTTSIGAYISGGETYSYGESVKEGSREAIYFVKNYKTICPNSKVVMAGYSQGAQVVSLSLQSLDASLIYAALTFGDPKLFLPEGKLNPITGSTPACSEGISAYSPYRANVPDCYAYEGILGGYNPYQPSKEYDGKLKAYCQYHDIICSAYLDLDRWYSGHASYKETGAYDAASEDVYNMIMGIEVSSRNNLAILFDASSSMTYMIDKYKADTIRAAKKVLSEGGKVSLYTYSDLDERDMKKICDFSTCSETNIEDFVMSIELDGGGDDPESTLSAAYHVMKELFWDAGAKKSLLIVTDAPYLNPDRDGITPEDVLNLSYEIDPVNIYILTDAEYEKDYLALATKSGGGIYSDEDDSAISSFESDMENKNVSDLVNDGVPILATTKEIVLEKSTDSSVNLSFASNAFGNILIMNGDVLGMMTENFVEITDVDFTKENTFCLAPVSENGFRGSLVCESFEEKSEIPLPKAPKTGVAGFSYL